MTGTRPNDRMWGALQAGGPGADSRLAAFGVRKAYLSGTNVSEEPICDVCR